MPAGNFVLISENPPLTSKETMSSKKKKEDNGSKQQRNKVTNYFAKKTPQLQDITNTQVNSSTNAGSKRKKPFVFDESFDDDDDFKNDKENYPPERKPVEPKELELSPAKMEVDDGDVGFSPLGIGEQPASSSSAPWPKRWFPLEIKRKVLEESRTCSDAEIAR